MRDLGDGFDRNRSDSFASCGEREQVSQPINDWKEELIASQVLRGDRNRVPPATFRFSSSGHPILMARNPASSTRRQPVPSCVKKERTSELDTRRGTLLPSAEYRDNVNTRIGHIIFASTCQVQVPQLTTERPYLLAGVVAELSHVCATVEVQQLHFEIANMRRHLYSRYNSITLRV